MAGERSNTHAAPGGRAHSTRGPRGALGILMALAIGACSGSAAAQVAAGPESVPLDTARLLAADRPAVRPCRDLDGDRLCSPLETVRGAASFIGPMLDQLAAAREILGEDATLADARRQLATGRSGLEKARDELAAGALCEAAKSYKKALAKLRGAKRALPDGFEPTLPGAGPPPDDGDGDVTRDDLEKAFLRLDVSRVDGAIRTVTRGRKTMDRLCNAVTGALTEKGVVADTDDAAGIVRLTNGKTIALARGVFSGGIAVGRTATFGGISLDDGTGIATSAEVASGSSGRQPAAISCLALRIAPVQPMAPEYPGPVELHHVNGYRDGAGILNLEAGMALGAELRNCPGVNPQGKALYYGMEIRVEVAGAISTIATDLEEGDNPVPLPSDLGTSAATLAKLRTRVFRRTCTIIGLDLLSCQAPVVIEAKDYWTFIRPLGAYGRANYFDTTFGVKDDGVAGDFESTQVVGVEVDPFLAGTSPVFGAQGYKVTGGVSSYPQIFPIATGDRFAVYETDFFNPNVLFMIDQMRQTGQLSPSALRWAHVSGARGGHPYRYSTLLPDLLRDRLAPCSLTASVVLPMGPARVDDDANTPANWPPLSTFTMPSVNDSFYRLPFDDGYRPGTGLMNIDDPIYTDRHPDWQAFALDLGAPYDTLLRAARGGVVTLVEDTDPYNYLDPDRPVGWPGIGNFIFIQHEDGTFAVYFHLALGSSQVEAGDLVHRGDPIALVSDTGTASGPHVHFGVATQQTSDWFSARVRYAALLGPSQTYEGCYVPREGAEFYATGQGVGL